MPGRFWGHPGERVEVVDLRRDLRSERRRIEPVDSLHRRLRGAQPGPERVDAGADRGDDADAGDEDARPPHGATASAIALNVASVRVAIGRVKPRSTTAAQAAILGRKTWSISTRLPGPRGSIRHVASMPSVAPP